MTGPAILHFATVLLVEEDPRGVADGQVAALPGGLQLGVVGNGERAMQVSARYDKSGASWFPRPVCQG
jgi:hypothetical protein